MEQINIWKTKEYDNGSIFEFRYVGIPFEIYNEKKVEKLIDAFLNKKEMHRDMLRNVACIRNILNNSEEKLLVVQYKDMKTDETVKYDNGILFFYECTKAYNDTPNYMEVKFQPGNGLKLSFSDFGGKKIIEYPNIGELKEEFDKVVNHISSLCNVNSVYLDNNSQAIIESYKLFYNEDPDFSKEDINIKMQTMLSILTQFDICFGDYSFSINDRMPESLTLLQMVNRLFPLGEVIVVEDFVELTPIAKEIIKIVGKTIRETIDNNQDMNEALIAISKTVYAGQYDISSVDDVKKLVEYPNINLTYNEANSSVQLLKTIKGELDNNKK